MIEVVQNGNHVLLDNDFFDKFEKRCFAFVGRKLQYVQMYINGKRQYIHRAITGAKKGEVVDHINGNTFDNRKENLRICSQQQNQFNQKAQTRNKSSRFKGVGWHKYHNKFRAYAKKDGHSFQLGYFKTPHEAAFVYDMKAFELFGEFAKPNLACSTLHIINIK